MNGKGAYQDGNIGGSWIYIFTQMDHTSSAPTFAAAAGWTDPPNHLVMKANNTRIQGSHKTTANRETVLNRWVRTRTGSPLRPSAERAATNTHLPALPWEELDCILYKLPENPAPISHTSECPPQTFSEPERARGHSSHYQPQDCSKEQKQVVSICVEEACPHI